MNDAWRSEAACRGMDIAIFMPAKEDSIAPALAVCGRCPVRAECLAAANHYGASTQGIWGGTSYRQRFRARAGRLAS